MKAILHHLILLSVLAVLFSCQNNEATIPEPIIYESYEIQIETELDFVSSQGLEIFESGENHVIFSKENLKTSVWQTQLNQEGDVVGRTQLLNPGDQVLPTEDGGFIVFGISGSFSFFTKVDAVGEVLWHTKWLHRRTILTNTVDGGFAFIEFDSNAYGNPMEARITQLESDGSFPWTQAIGTFDYAPNADFIQLSNGDFGIFLIHPVQDGHRKVTMYVTDTQNTSPGKEIQAGGNALGVERVGEALLLHHFNSGFRYSEIDESGEVLWTSAPIPFTPTKVIRGYNKYLIIGSEYNPAYVRFDARIAAMDLNGDVVEINLDAAPGSHHFSSMKELRDGTIILTGNSEDNRRTTFLKLVPVR